MRFLAWFTVLLCDACPAQTLHGAGATFPAPLYLKWIASFQKSHPGTSIDYAETGSVAGIDQVLNQRVDFAGSDVPLTDDQLERAPIKVLQIPTVIGAVAPIHNVQGEFQGLKFTPEVLADIYLGKIRKWNDPAIAGLNRGAKLPGAEISVVHRSDGSGTTWIWTTFLSDASAEWKARAGAGTSIVWPVGMAAEKNEGIAALVRRTPNSIGYVEAIYAILHQVNLGSVRNRAGKFVKADIESITAAISTSSTPRGDFRAKLTRSSDPRSYPVSSFTWLLLPAENRDIEKQRLMVSFVEWILTSGQRECSALGYAPLPEDVIRAEQSMLQSLH
jgi:phosphate transport system substrate-binding protein